MEIVHSTQRQADSRRETHDAPSAHPVQHGAAAFSRMDLGALPLLAPAQRVAWAGAMQRTRGNRATAGLLRAASAPATVAARLPVQAKLTVGAPDDAFEREADRVADRVMRMPAGHDGGSPPRPSSPAIQRACTACGQKKKDDASSSGLAQGISHFAVPDEQARRFFSGGQGGRTSTMWSTGRSGDGDDPAWFGAIQRSASTSADAAADPVSPHLEPQLRDLQQAGRPLSHAERGFFEPRFDSRFHEVRIHSDERADRLARALSAEAFTVGNHIAFRSGRYAPESDAGRRLMAHELTHVVQQTGPQPLAAESVQRRIGDGHDLVSPRFSGNVTLEAAFDNELLVGSGAEGEPVRLIQEALVAMGYALPRSMSAARPGRMDGSFGPETKAAITQFQRDAGAVLVDGVVGPETMGLLDTHDIARAGARPPAITGPVAAPLAAAGCDAPFRGVTFTLAGQVAAGVANPATIAAGVVGGHPFLRMQGNAPITHNPSITIAAPTDAVAQQFRVGFVQTLLTSARVATYGGGASVSTVVPTLPIKDGDPVNYHPIFVTPPVPNIVEDFTTRAATVNLNWPDVPGDGKFINLLDNPSCAASGLPAQTMTSMRMRDTFRLWVVVQHRQSGCVHSLHHVDWDLDWSATVLPGPAVTITSNVNNVTEPDGDGAPRFVQGGQVPGAIATNVCA